MAIDTTDLAFPKAPKGELRVEVKRTKRLSLAALEKEARAEARRRYGWHCAVPGCKESGVHLHHIVYRSQSKRKRWQVENLVPLCTAHHELEHAGKITIHPRTADGELLITGETQYLKFKL